MELRLGHEDPAKVLRDAKLSVPLRRVAEYEKRAGHPAELPEPVRPQEHLHERPSRVRRELKRREGLAFRPHRKEEQRTVALLRDPPVA